MKRVIIRIIIEQVVIAVLFVMFCGFVMVERYRDSICVFGTGLIVVGLLIADTITATRIQNYMRERENTHPQDP